MNSFDGFGLAEPIARALVQENYVTPTPIQAQTVPLVLEGRDVIGIAQTGTGKTAAFALPILHRLSNSRTPLERKTCRVLVLSPTRELSSQILDSFNTYGRHLDLSATLAIGGVPMGKQVRALMNGVDVLVATPGRLLDLVNSNALRLNRVEVLVLDEADRMLDMGFIHDIRQHRRQDAGAAADAAVFRHHAPGDRRIGGADAAQSREGRRDAGGFDRGAGQPARRPCGTRQQGPDPRRDPARRGDGTRASSSPAPSTAPTNSCARSPRRGSRRRRSTATSRSHSASACSPPSARARSRILVATDIAARGIDVDGISHVVNYDLPNEPESYVHRIGRTARAGATGVAISLCDHDEVPYLRSIEKLIRMGLPATDRRSSPGRDLNPPAAAPERRHEAPRRDRHQRGRRGAPQHSHAAGNHAATGKAGPSQTRARQACALRSRAVQTRTRQARSHSRRMKGLQIRSRLM